MTDVRLTDALYDIGGLAAKIVEIANGAIEQPPSSPWDDFAAGMRMAVEGAINTLTIATRPSDPEPDPEPQPITVAEVADPDNWGRPIKLYAGQTSRLVKDAVTGCRLTESWWTVAEVLAFLARVPGTSFYWADIDTDVEAGS